MKGIKNRSYKIAILLILTGSMAFLYWFGFYKQFDPKTIPQNTDGIIMIDVKNTRNHFIFSYLKNPSLWGSGDTASKKSNSSDLSNFGIEIPHYLALFHVQNLPLDQWYFIATIDDETQFEKTVIEGRFVKTKSHKSLTGYYSKTSKVYLIRYKNQILYCSNALKHQEICNQIAENLFINRLYFDSKKIEKVIENPNAVTIWIQKNQLFEEDGILNITFKEDEIVADGQLKWKPKYRKTAQFNQNSNALLSLGFNFDILRDQDILKNHSVQINKMIGFNLDSLFIHHPTQTELIFHNIIEKKDSAITYEFDDDFNPVKKMVVHTNREPSFYFSIKTDNSKKIYDYLKTQKIIDEHEVFINFPLAMTKTFVRNNSLILKANTPKTILSKKPSIPKIGYLQMNFDQFQEKDWRFLIAKNKNFALLKPFEKFQINLTAKNNLVDFHASLKTKKEKPLLGILN